MHKHKHHHRPAWHRAVNKLIERAERRGIKIPLFSKKQVVKFFAFLLPAVLIVGAAVGVCILT